MNRAVLSGLLVLTILPLSAYAQETIFNVPSGDILQKGKAYSELDIAYKHSDGSVGLTPRFVAGIGKNIELGLNVNGLTTADGLQTTLTPAIKWKPYSNENGWSFLLGDEFFVPIQNRTYNAGNYLYVEFVKSWRTQTRATFGSYYLTPSVVAAAQRAGGQFAIEQPVGKSFTVAADWYTGNHALGYVTPGVIVKFTEKLTWYLSYQIGNGGVANGNHQLLTEFGWNFN